MSIARLAADNWATTRKETGFTLPSLDSTEPVAVGEGLTRTSAPTAWLFPMELTLQGAKPLRCLIRATSWDQAEAFAKARHPNLISLSRIDEAPQPAGEAA